MVGIEVTNFFQYQGATYTSWLNGDFATLDSKRVMDDLSDLGANSIAVTSTYYTYGLRSSAVVNDPVATESSENLSIAITDAHARGMQVMLKPHLDPYDGSWRGKLDPLDVDAFFENYKGMILNQAAIAQEHGVALLSLGCEIDQLTTTEYLPYWTEIIAEVRAIYDGDLTYSAHWFDPASVSFWDQLDIIGINPYVPLGDDPNAGVEAFSAAWTASPEHGSPLDSLYDGLSPVEYYEAISEKWDRSIIFTELSYASTDRGSAYPGHTDPQGDANWQSQADLHEAFFNVWMNEDAPDWMEGVFFWLWYPHTDLGEIRNYATDLTPQGKPAEEIIGRFFSLDDGPPDPALREIEVNARVSAMGGAGATTYLVIDGLIVDEVHVSARLFDQNWGWEGDWQEVTFTGLFRARDEIDIQIWFNDSEGHADENLFVDWIEVDGRRYQGEDAISTADLGNPIDGTGTLYLDGSLTFDGVEAPVLPNRVPLLEMPAQTQQEAAGEVVLFEVLASVIEGDTTDVFKFRIGVNGNENTSGGELYDGPVNHLERQLVLSNANEVVTGTPNNDFINGRGGTDGIDAGAGNDVLDGGTGSNFLSGGSGIDIFFTDARTPELTTWSTITDFDPATEEATIWGWQPGISSGQWVASNGAPSFHGATFHVDVDGNGLIDTSITFSGLSQAQVPPPLELDGLLWFL